MPMPLMDAYNENENKYDKCKFWDVKYSRRGDPNQILKWHAVKSITEAFGEKVKTLFYKWTRGI